MMADDAPPSRALLAAHVVALLRSRMRDAPARAATRIGVIGPGGVYDIVDVRLRADEIVLKIMRRPQVGRR
jgi:hypothetical protein